MAVAPQELRWHEEVDVGIVGAGGCGLVAALAAVQDDLRVVVWEKTAAAGGSTALSGGLIPAAGSAMQRAAGIFETGEDLLRDVLARNGGRSDPALTGRLCESAGTLVDWLVDGLGVHLELVDEVGDPGHTRRRLHAPPSRSGRQLIAELVRLVERRGVRLRLSSPVLHLWTDGSGAAIGARIKVPRKSPANVRCGTLVLASDGFGANVELVRQHCPPAAGLPHAGHAGSTGDGIGWADDIGAATRDLGAFDAHASVAVGSNQLLPWELITHGAILVNQGGRRFADETRGPAALVTPLSAQPGRIAYEVLDARILKCLADRHPYFASEVAPRVLRRADEVEVLARQFQIDPGALAQTVAAYNAAVATGMDALGRTAFEAPLAPPFYAARVSAALLQTLGGLVIDTSARVLRRDGTPIPNLYAGGGAAAGVSGPGGDGYLLGMGLLGALGWGRIAGEHARNEILAARAATQVSPAPPPASEPDGPAA